MALVTHDSPDIGMEDGGCFPVYLTVGVQQSCLNTGWEAAHKHVHGGFHGHHVVVDYVPDFRG